MDNLVRIEVRGEIAKVVEWPAGVTVEIVDYDCEAEEPSIYEHEHSNRIVSILCDDTPLLSPRVTVYRGSMGYRGRSKTYNYVSDASINRLRMFATLTSDDGFSIYPRRNN